MLAPGCSHRASLSLRLGLASTASSHNGLYTRMSQPCSLLAALPCLGVDPPYHALFAATARKRSQRFAGTIDLAPRLDLTHRGAGCGRSSPQGPPCSAAF